METHSRKMCLFDAVAPTAPVAQYEHDIIEKWHVTRHIPQNRKIIQVIVGLRNKIIHIALFMSYHHQDGGLSFVAAPFVVHSSTQSNLGSGVHTSRSIVATLFSRLARGCRCRTCRGEKSFSQSITCNRACSFIKPCNFLWKSCTVVASIIF